MQAAATTDEQQASAVTITRAQQQATLAIMLRHVRSSWLPLKRSNLDAKVLRRLIGLEAFIDFEKSDFVARGALLRGAVDAHAAARHRYVTLAHAGLGAPGDTAEAQKRARWIAGERGGAWRAVTLAAKGLAGWGAGLWQERQALIDARVPGASLMMLSAVRNTSHHTSQRCVRSDIHPDMHTTFLTILPEHVTLASC